LYFSHIQLVKAHSPFLGYVLVFNTSIFLFLTEMSFFENQKLEHLIIFKWRVGVGVEDKSFNLSHSEKEQQ
jgi:hypothetical protein